MGLLFEAFKSFPANMRRAREASHRKLTRGERAFALAFSLLPGPLVLAGVLLLVYGAPKL